MDETELSRLRRQKSLWRVTAIGSGLLSLVLGAGLWAKWRRSIHAEARFTELAIEFLGSAEFTIVDFGDEKLIITDHNETADEDDE